MKVKSTFILIALAGVAFFAVTKFKGGASSSSASAAGNRAFIYGKGAALTNEKEEKVRDAIFANRGLDMRKMGSGDQKIDGYQFQQIIAELDAAMRYYPHTYNLDKPSKGKELVRPLQQTKNALLKYRDNFVA